MVTGPESFHACVQARKAAEARGLPLDCPIYDVVHGISGKWTPFVLKALDERVHRFGELRRLLPVSQRMLTQTLRELQRDGFVHREVLPTNPPSVEYSLTPLGLSIMGELRALFRWVERNGEAVKAARAVFDLDDRTGATEVSGDLAVTAPASAASPSKANAPGSGRRAEATPDRRPLPSARSSRSSP